MNDKRMIYRPEGYPLSFEWSGGAYIDVYAMNDTDPKIAIVTTGATGAWEMLRASEDGAPFTCIGVWDYATDKPSIPVTREAFEAECDEWLADPDNRESYGL